MPIFRNKMLLQGCRSALYSTVVIFVDDIPVRGFIGRLEEGNFIPHVHKVLFFTHHVFNIEYNEDQVDS